MEKVVKFGRRVFKSVQIGRSLKMLRKRYQEENQPDCLVIPYILTCSAYLEAKLNDSLFETAKQYGEEFYQSMMSLSLPAKLKILVPVLTKGRYSINKEHTVYKRLISLIKVRNTIAHAKSQLEEISASSDELTEIFILEGGIERIPKQFTRKADMTLDTVKDFSPLEYHEALNMLDKDFLARRSGKLSTNTMCVKRPINDGWKEQFTTVVKYFD